MKKLLCAILTLCILCAFAACGKESKVTIYIPETMTMTSPTGEVGVVKYIFEEGWESKESFSVNLQIDGISDMEDVSVAKMSYSNRTVVMEQTGILRTTTTHNEKGQVVSNTNELTNDGTLMQRTEITYTYDARGRKLTEESKVQRKDLDTPVVTTVTYTYTDTATGSEGRSESGSTVVVLTYDQNDRLICTTNTLRGEEVSRVENTYDEAGNLICSKTYSMGELISTQETTYRTVEVSKATADRLPNFKRGK